MWSHFQLTPLAKTKRSSSGKSFPPLGPDTKVFVVWVERFDDIGRNAVFKLKSDFYHYEDHQMTLLIILQRTSAIWSVATCSFFCTWMTLLFSFCRELPLVWSVGGNQHRFGSQPEQQHFLQVLASLSCKQANSSANGHVPDCGEQNNGVTKTATDKEGSTTCGCMKTELWLSISDKQFSSFLSHVNVLSADLDDSR